MSATATGTENPEITTRDIAQIKALLDVAALSYDAREHGELDPVAAYQTRQGRHQVCINLHPDLDWRVIDQAADGSATFVGRLEGADDLRGAAVSYAEDYATQCQLFHIGAREDPPILRPKPMRMNRGSPDRPQPQSAPAEQHRAATHRRSRQ